MTAAGGEPARVEIVGVTPQDWQAHRDLRLEALRIAPEAFGSRYEDELANDELTWRERIGRIAFWQARLDAEPVGMIGLWEVAEPEVGSPDAPMAAAYLVAMYVRATARRLGIGSRLVETAAAEAARRGHDRLLLQVSARNLPARAMYESAGFAPVDLPLRAGEDDRGQVVLARPLTSGETDRVARRDARPGSHR